ncbi:hypothetical protein NBH00_14975 [Paraconexibacter antarcticus]|uniref:SCP2 domain-containing protein n=1 Tax=Paraconexibacter antarcticus TaxID=2949664 RepID=A0ABY5DLG7_9ACTN|nr:hypothetical protein [Paraconexibacter antarcticus]UTI62661.1 hypothetical protein NBH00_14975 [Paraconexibacter antarcticus]
MADAAAASSAPASVRLRRLPEMTVAFFAAAATDAELSERMSFADTVVHVHFTDLDGDAAATVYLDRDPIGAELGAVGAAEVQLWAPAAAYLDLFTGREALPIAILRGAVQYKGPVRKFLRVVPILQSFDFGMFRDPTEPPAASVA